VPDASFLARNQGFLDREMGYNSNGLKALRSQESAGRFQHESLPVLPVSQRGLVLTAEGVVRGSGPTRGVLVRADAAASIAVFGK
jgi:hypothetical protein